MKPGDLVIIKRFIIEGGEILPNPAIGMILGDDIQNMRDCGIIKVLIEGKIVEVYEDKAEPIMTGLEP
jgi:hypothetical protein